MIYFDNAATTYYKPHCVKKAVNRFINSANPGRSGHDLSIKSATEIFKARLILKELFNVPSEDNVIFCQNCTEALNTAIMGTVQERKHIVVSCFEHNSVLRPITHLREEGKIEVTYIFPKNKYYITAEDVKDALHSNTYMVIVNHISNVTGNKNDIFNIGALCKKRNILFLVDCAQSAGHIDIDMQKNNISIATIAGHKGLYSPQSIGVLLINDNVKINPLKRGGTGTNSIDTHQPTNLPEQLESGTLSTPLIAGLRAGAIYVLKNFDKHTKRVANLTRFLYNQLKKQGYTIYSYPQNKYGVILFNLSSKDSVEVSNFLNKNKVYVRSGLHCAPMAHQFLGTTEKGAVRISLNHNNTKGQICKLCKLLNQIDNL